MKKLIPPKTIRSDDPIQETETGTSLNGGTNPRGSGINRRKFVEVAATSALAFTILPRHVIGGRNFVAPSDKITLAYIGIGTQGIRELLPMLANDHIRIIAVCDPNKEAIGYKDWEKNGSEMK